MTIKVNLVLDRRTWERKRIGLHRCSDEEMARMDKAPDYHRIIYCLDNRDNIELRADESTVKHSFLEFLVEECKNHTN